MLKRIVVLFNFLVFILFFSGCDYLGGIASIEVREDINQSILEDFLIKNTSLEEQNITITSSIIMALENLNQLQDELGMLNHQIENISRNLDELENSSNLNPEMFNQVMYLKELVGKSQSFVNLLENSTYFWFSYLNQSRTNVSNLNFSYNGGEVDGIINSISEPLEVFEE